MRPACLIAALLMLSAGATLAVAVEPDERLPDPVLEARARAISKELRCPVCQSQSLDESDSDLARDLRLIIRERLVAGDSDEAVIDFIAHRYGDFVRLRPPLDHRTLLLWTVPAAVPLMGIIGVFVYFFRRRRQE